MDTVWDEPDEHSSSQCGCRVSERHLAETRLQPEGEADSGASGQRQGMCGVSGLGVSLRSYDGLVPLTASMILSFCVSALASLRPSV